MRILVVEDETRLATLVRRGLMTEGHAVDIAATGEEGLDWLAAASYDAIVLDVMLPGIDGFEVCRRIRNGRIQTPILLLTAKDAVPDRVTGLDAGADDYLVKPFALAELTARLRASADAPRALRTWSCRSVTSASTPRAAGPGGGMRRSTSGRRSSRSSST